MLSHQCLTRLTPLVMATSIALSGCGASSVSSSDICGKARPLLTLVANSGPKGYAEHMDEWHRLLDMAKNAEDPALAEFAARADEKSRNDGNYYSPLNQIMLASCYDREPDMDKA